MRYLIPLALASLLVTAAVPARASSPDRVLVYSAGSSISLGYGRLTQTLKQAGASQVDETWPKDLSAYRVVFLLDVAPLDATKLAALASFAQAGGGVVVVGEPLGNGEAPVNAIAKALAVAPRAGQGYTFDRCNELERKTSSPLTQGAPTLSVSRGLPITGGTALYGDANDAAIAVDGTVVIAGDSNSFADSGCLGCCSTSDSTTTFWRNLYTNLPATHAAGGGGADGGGSGSGDDAGVTGDDAGDGTSGGASSSGGDASGGCSVGGAPTGGEVGFIGLVLSAWALGRRRRARAHA